ncbi:MAG: SDR family oxidoreductase [Tepidisphaeraceae bacterium]|jgi:short-subunit dehydrogenase
MTDSPGKTALVTGASVGIGRDLAELFARDGHSLVLVARNEPGLGELAAKLRDQYRVNAEVIVQDLSVADGPRRIFDFLQTKSIDYLVNNAGFGTHGPFAQSDLATQLGMLQVNVAALTHLTRLFLPEMLKRGGGRIMNVASVAAFLPGPSMAVYYASKAYVLSFSEALANELAGSGVTVTAMCPGPTKTEFQKRAGIEDSLLFKMRMMDSMTAARIGYGAMMRGRRSVVTGLSNKISVWAMRFVPRRATAAMARKLNDSR